MNVAACVAAVLASAAMSASAQGFRDLDFDEAHVPDPAGFAALPWDQGAPGWGHSDGDSTDAVTYPFGHAGYSQTFSLVQAPFGAASGLYGLGMRSGTFHEEEPHGDFVQAFISQTGSLGPAVTSVDLLASSYLFGLTLNGRPIDMRPVGLDPTSPTYDEDLTTYWGEWTGDVSSFAGQVVELKIVDLQVPPNYSTLVIDEIQFLPVPEPGYAQLLGLGLLGLLLARGGVLRRMQRPRSGAGSVGSIPSGARR
jgi:hypothetical protein